MNRAGMAARSHARAAADRLATFVFGLLQTMSRPFLLAGAEATGNILAVQGVAARAGMGAWAANDR